jgi:hypothetical protein
MPAFEGGEQWAPVLTKDSTHLRYVQVGTLYDNPTTTCVTYEEFNDDKEPSWATDGSSVELKSHILCCKDPSYTTSTDVMTPTVDTDTDVPLEQNVESPTLSDGTTFDLEAAIKLELEPVWIDEEDGWEGGSHDDAEDFCENIVGKQLCPFAAYCPHGKKVLCVERVSYGLSVAFSNDLRLRQVPANRRSEGIPLISILKEFNGHLYWGLRIM